MDVPHRWIVSCFIAVGLLVGFARPFMQRHQLLATTLGVLIAFGVFVAPAVVSDLQARFSRRE